MHDQGTIFVGIFIQGIEFSNGIVERLANESTVQRFVHSRQTHLFGQVTRAIGRIEDFVVEHGEVQRQAKTNGMSGLHLILGDVEGVVVGTLRLFDHFYRQTKGESPSGGGGRVLLLCRSSPVATSERYR